MMERNRLSYRTLNKCIRTVMLVFILVLVLRVLLIFVPPIVLHVSPQLVNDGQRVSLWGIMGSENVRAATTLMLNAVPIKPENIENWSFFSIRFKLSTDDIKSLKKNAHGLVYLKYKHYQSARFLIALSHNKAVGIKQERTFIPSLTMRNGQTVYAQNNLLFFLDPSRVRVNPLFVEEYLFTIETNTDSYTVYPQEWNIVSDAVIAFPVPLKFFARPPQGRVNARIRVMYKNMNVKTVNVDLATSPLLSPELYEFVAEFAYETMFRQNATMLMPLSRPWQYVHFYNKRSRLAKEVDEPKMRTALVRGFIKNFDLKKQTLLITRYPFRPFDWKSRFAAEERAVFMQRMQGINATAVQNTLFIPQYLQNTEEYFHKVLFKKISRVATQVSEEVLTLDALITRLASEVNPLLVDVNILRDSLIMHSIDDTLINFTYGLEKSTLSKKAKGLAILAQLLREYGIPSQVVVGLRYVDKQKMKKTNVQTALCLEIFTSEYGIVPFELGDDFSSISLAVIDYRFVSYTVLEQITYLEYLNQKPKFPNSIRSFTLRNW